MAITKNLTYTLPATGNRESSLTEKADGTRHCVYRATDTGGTVHSAQFSGADIVAAWAANASYFAALQAANPTVDSAALAAQVALVTAVLKAYGDNAAGFTVT